MIKIDIQHLPEVQAAIKKRADAIMPALRSASSQARRLLIAELSRYPAERPGQRYRRTGQLRRGWERASPLDLGAGFQLINPVRHAGLVQGDNQAWMHAGRWTPASQIAHEHREEVLALYEDAILEAVE